MMKSMLVFALAVLPLVMTGCPVSEVPRTTFDYAGVLYTPAEFWPFAEGNYWLWMDPDNTNDWISKEILKVREVGDARAYLVETTNHIGGGSIWVRGYFVAHPKGLFHAVSEDRFLLWTETPDDLSLLVPVLIGAFIDGTFQYPAAYNSDQEYTVDTLARVAPFDRCSDNDPNVVDGGPNDFMVQPDHKVLLTHAPGVCGDATRSRIIYGCYAYGIGPIVLPGWRRGTLVRAVIDGYELSL